MDLACAEPATNLPCGQNRRWFGSGGGTTCERLGVSPLRALAVEDSVNGVVAAKAARMTCVAVPEPAQRGDRRFGIADAVLDSLEGLAPWLEPDKARGHAP